MLVCTAAQMRELDRTTIEDYGVPGVVLMEAAGRGVVDLITRERGPEARVLVLCGSGNNGGDGYVVARHLLAREYRVTVYLVADRAKIGGDALVNLKVLDRMGADVQPLETEADLERAESALVHASVIVDALLGTGLTSEVRGQYRTVLERANRCRGLKVAVDIPSGLDADNGRVLGVAFDADHTVTFGLPKVGLVTHPGVERVGKLHVVDIGIPPGATADKEFIAEILEPEMIGRWLMPRPDWGHKGTYGHLLVIAGSEGKTGAAVLCGEAALRCGVGLATVASPLPAMRAMEAKTREVMLAPLYPDDVAIDDTDRVVEHCLGLLQGKAAVAIGPGIVRGPAMQRVICRLVEESTVPIVVDADGLNELAGNLSCLEHATVPVLLTPHPGEMSRLTGLTVDAIQADRIGVAADFAQKQGVYVALKGARTIIAAPDGRAYINPTGNTGMGSGGTGDVLTGMVGGFLAQQQDPLDALCLGVFIHGLAGDRAAEQKGQHGLLASDLLGEVGGIMKQWE
jgi:NAD(P)H-hydrate epimerase